MRNKVAMITGAAVGIGRAVALKMAEEGVSLILADINAEKLASVKAETEKFGVRVETYTLDVSKETDVNETVQDGLKKFGKIDILINNAALWRNFQPFEETEIATWKTFLDINVMGTVYCTRAVLPNMYAQGYGRIVNLASVAGVYGNGNMVLYSATKGAIISMSKALAKETSGRGVTVNSVSPGTVNDSSDLNVDAFEKSDMCYAGRTGTARENAELICFLASEKAGYISGQNIQIDGCRKKI